MKNDVEASDVDIYAVIDKALTEAGGFVGMKYLALAPILAAGALVMNIDARAQADVNDFIEDVHGELGVSNFVSGDSGLAAQGIWICNQLDNGAPLSFVLQRFVQANPGILPHTAGRLAAIAVWDICPWRRNDIH